MTYNKSLGIIELAAQNDEVGDSLTIRGIYIPASLSGVSLTDSKGAMIWAGSTTANNPIYLPLEIFSQFGIKLASNTVGIIVYLKKHIGARM